MMSSTPFCAFCSAFFSTQHHRMKRRQPLKWPCDIFIDWDNTGTAWRFRTHMTNTTFWEKSTRRCVRFRSNMMWQLRPLLCRPTLGRKEKGKSGIWEIHWSYGVQISRWWLCDVMQEIFSTKTSAPVLTVQIKQAGTWNRERKNQGSLKSNSSLDYSTRTRTCSNGATSPIDPLKGQIVVAEISR